MIVENIEMFYDHMYIKTDYSIWFTKENCHKD